jgi:N-acetylglutamate synthase-like GNAT family acetyltransferase
MSELAIQRVEPERMLRSRHQARFGLECLRVYAQLTQPNLSLPPNRRQVRHILDTFRQGNRIIAAVADEQVAGLASYYNGCDYTRIGWLHGIVVNMSDRRQGVGSQMLEYIMTDMQESGARECRLEALQNVVGYYTLRGFVDIDSSDDANRLMRREL